LIPPDRTLTQKSEKENHETSDNKSTETKLELAKKATKSEVAQKIVSCEGFSTLSEDKGKKQLASTLEQNTLIPSDDALTQKKEQPNYETSDSKSTETNLELAQKEMKMELAKKIRPSEGLPTETENKAKKQLASKAINQLASKQKQLITRDWTLTEQIEQQDHKICDSESAETKVELAQKEPKLELAQKIGKSEELSTVSEDKAKKQLTSKQRPLSLSDLALPQLSEQQDYETSDSKSNEKIFELPQKETILELIQKKIQDDDKSDSESTVSDAIPLTEMEI